MFKGDNEETNLLMKAAMSGNPDIVQTVLKKISEDAKGDKILIQVNKTFRNSIHENMRLRDDNVCRNSTRSIIMLIYYGSKQ